MAIATYNDLAAAIKVWAARSDSVFSNQIETFVGMHEDRMYNGSGSGPSDPLQCDALAAREMETTATVVITAGTGTMPNSISSVRTIRRSGDKVGLDYMTPRQFALFDANATSGNPGYWTVENLNLKITPSYTGNILVNYFASFAAISVNTQSNALLTAYPRLYLTGCLFEAFSFLQDVELAMGHFARYRALVSGINQSANSARFGGGPLKIRTRQAMP